MNNKCLESLPDELLLLIFSYLYKFEILNIFTYLNQRFQQIIEPYSYDIDLTHHNRPFYRYFQCFCQHILPIHGHNIRSLKLTGNHQIQLLHPHIHWLTNLKSLKIEDNERLNSDDFSKQKQFIIDMLSISSLSELSIFPAKHGLLRTIASCASHNLTKLIIIFDGDILHFAGIPQLPSVKYFYINLWSIKSLVQLFKLIPNIEELNLSMLRFKKFKGLALIKIPQTLRKLHLEIGGFSYSVYYPTFEFIRNFLNIFKDQIQSLTVIFINAVEEFSNYEKLQTLIKNFNRLETFEYYIHTIHEPVSPSLFPNVEQLQDLSYILYTFPRPQQFDTMSSRTSAHYFFDSHDRPNVVFNYRSLCVFNLMRFEDLPTTLEYKVNLRLVNMQHLGADSFEDHSTEERRFLSEVVAHSPNLTCIYTAIGDTVDFINPMSEIIPVRQKKQIIYFELRLHRSTISWTFFSDLSAILPNLKSLEIELVPRTFDYDTISLTELVRDLRIYLRKLSRLVINLNINKENCRNAFERYKNELNELSQQTRDNQSLYYTVKVANYDEDDVFLNIWL